LKHGTLSSVYSLIGTALVCVAALALALVSQHRFGMQPCSWCVLQRVLFLSITLSCVLGLGLGWLWRKGLQLGAGLGFLLALCGVAAALWQHFKAAGSVSCNLTLADKIVSRWLQLDAALPQVFEARASCSDATMNLLGVPYDFWSMALFVLTGLVMLRVLVKR
jgi:protein dithiol:quinone oxidoreductase